MKRDDSDGANGPRMLARPFPIGMAAITGIAAIGWVDFITGVEYRVYPLYFLPLSLVAWHFGRRGAFAGAALCAFTWLGTSYNAGRETIWIFNFFMQGVALLVVGWLIASLRSALATAIVLSRIDPLTGLLNRRSFYESCEPIVELGRRHSRPITLAYIDLDNFKNANDGLGHAAGDEALRSVGRLLQQSVRRGDVLARFGGDEFVALLPETGPDGARPLLERLRAGLAELTAQTSCPVSASIGAVSYTAPPAGIEEMMRHADHAMYAAKAAGKNRIELRFGESLPRPDPTPPSTSPSR